MEPALRPGQLVLAVGFGRLRAGTIVIVAHDGREKNKRLHRLRGGEVFVLGDNAPQSTDSRDFGWLPERLVIGRVIWPKRPRKP